MSLEKSLHPWNHHHNLYHEPIRHPQKFPVTLFIYCYYLNLCVFKNTASDLST